MYAKYTNTVRPYAGGTYAFCVYAILTYANCTNKASIHSVPQAQCMHAVTMLHAEALKKGRLSTNISIFPLTVYVNRNRGDTCNKLSSTGLGSHPAGPV
jgi:hypothetical protein